jgi:hypothetical protein
MNQEEHARDDQLEEIEHISECGDRQLIQFVGCGEYEIVSGIQDRIE